MMTSKTKADIRLSTFSFKSLVADTRTPFEALAMCCSETAKCRPGVHRRSPALASKEVQAVEVEPPLPRLKYIGTLWGLARYIGVYKNISMMNISWYVYTGNILRVYG